MKPSRRLAEAIAGTCVHRRMRLVRGSAATRPDTTSHAASVPVGDPRVRRTDHVSDSASDRS